MNTFLGFKIRKTYFFSPDARVAAMIPAALWRVAPPRHVTRRSRWWWGLCWLARSRWTGSRSWSWTSTRSAAVSAVQSWPLCVQERHESRPASYKVSLSVSKNWVNLTKWITPSELPFRYFLSFPSFCLNASSLHSLCPMDMCSSYG